MAMEREAMLTALMARLQGDATLAGLATSGVHLVRAPQGTERPFVEVRNRPGVVDETIGNPRATKTFNVAVVAYADGSGSTTAAAIDERIDVLLRDHVLSVASPYSASPARRRTEIDDPDTDAGGEFDAVGGVYRIQISGGS